MLDHVRIHSRYLGGLLSAYALSGEPILLARADELGRKLLPVFNSPSGLPHYAVNPETWVLPIWIAVPHIIFSRGDTSDSSDRPNRMLLAEIASFQIEYKYLSHLTGQEDYFQKASDWSHVDVRSLRNLFIRLKMLYVWCMTVNWITGCGIPYGMLIQGSRLTVSVIHSWRYSAYSNWLVFRSCGRGSVGRQRSTMIHILYYHFLNILGSTNMSSNNIFFLTSLKQS